MKFRVIVDVEISESIAETMKRTGFQVCPDGSKMQVKVPNAPAITSRKTKIQFIPNPVDIIPSEPAKA